MSLIIIRIIFYALIGYILYLLIKFFQGISKSGREVSSSAQKTGMMVKDNVCQTYLPEEDALKEKYKGETLYFCSKKCRDSFLKSHKNKG